MIYWYINTGTTTCKYVHGLCAGLMTLGVGHLHLELHVGMSWKLATCPYCGRGMCFVKQSALKGNFTLILKLSRAFCFQFELTV